MTLIKSWNWYINEGKFIKNKQASKKQLYFSVLWKERTRKRKWGNLPGEFLLKCTEKAWTISGINKNRFFFLCFNTFGYFKSKQDPHIVGIHCAADCVYYFGKYRNTFYRLECIATPNPWNGIEIAFWRKKRLKLFLTGTFPQLTPFPHPFVPQNVAWHY